MTKKIKNETVKDGQFEFFGISEPFFKTAELMGKDIKRFVNRNDEKLDLRNALEYKQNFAIIGDTGTGKSSLMLKFKEEYGNIYYTDYIYFSMNANTEAEMKEEFFRMILSRLLILIIENDELLDNFDPKEIAIDTKRLNVSISLEEMEKKQIEITPEIEANFQNLMLSSFLPIKLSAKLQGKLGKESHKIELLKYERHTESTLREAIIKIIHKLPATVVLFIDEMDRIIKAIRPNQNWLEEVINLLKFTSEIIVGENLLFVFALQPEIHDVFLQADRGESDDAILRYVPSFIRISGFDLTLAKEAVAESLKFAGYKGKPEDLFQADVMEIILAASKNNPRRFMTYLLKLTSVAYKKKQTSITPSLAKEFIAAKFAEPSPK